MARDALGFKSTGKDKPVNKWRNGYYVIRILLALIGVVVSASAGAMIGSRAANSHTDAAVADVERTITEIEIPEAYDDSLVHWLIEENTRQQFLIDGLMLTNELLRQEANEIAAEYYRHLEVYHSEYKEDSE